MDSAGESLSLRQAPIKAGIALRFLRQPRPVVSVMCWMGEDVRSLICIILSPFLHFSQNLPLIKIRDQSYGKSNSYTMQLLSRTHLQRDVGGYHKACCSIQFKNRLKFYFFDKSLTQIYYHRSVRLIIQYFLFLERELDKHKNPNWIFLCWNTKSYSK